VQTPFNSVADAQTFIARLLEETAWESPRPRFRARPWVETLRDPGWRPWVETLESCTSTFISINHDSHLMHLSQSQRAGVVMFSNVESAHGGASVLLTRTLF